MSLAENYRLILDEIASACRQAGRQPGEVNLIAVSKTHPLALVEEAAALGQVHFGENRIAEMAEKKAAARHPGIQWHLIGQLQTNKVKLLDADVILHSLDRVSLAEKLEQRFAPLGQKIRLLLQVNCSGEANKSGVALAEVDALIHKVAALEAIDVLGLMTMAENTSDEKKIRGAFSKLRELSQKISDQKLFPAYQGWLSMGMSGDFKYAIAEGATHVRIGSAIFGGRTLTPGSSPL